MQTIIFISITKSQNASFSSNFHPKSSFSRSLKGGTGKTSLALETAVRASLYGAKVLCVDLDSQGNLTQACNQNPEEVPVMIDHLAEGYPIYDSLIQVTDGIDLFPSRIENALLDEVIRNNNLPLETLYREPFSQLQSYYDLIIFDCPPSLGQSVAAAALAADLLVAPVTPDKFALAGLESTRQMLIELEEDYSIAIPCYPLLNKFELEDKRSIDAWNIIREQLGQTRKQGSRSRMTEDVSAYSNEKDLRRSGSSSAVAGNDRMSPCWIRLSRAFPEAASQMVSIFDSALPNEAKADIDSLTQELLGIKRSDFMAKSVRTTAAATARATATEENQKGFLEEIEY